MRNVNYDLIAAKACFYEFIVNTYNMSYFDY